MLALFMTSARSVSEDMFNRAPTSNSLKYAKARSAATLLGGVLEYHLPSLARLGRNLQCLATRESAQNLPMGLSLESGMKGGIVFTVTLPVHN